MEASDLISHAATVMEAVRLEGAQSDDFIPDEIAICFPTNEALDQFVKEAVDDYGLEHFNGVRSDHMRRLDRLGEGFDVQFEFLRLPGREWRIECMAVWRGIAPLHEKALRDSGGEPVLIHVSWKMPNLDDYSLLMREMPTRHGLFRKAEYANTYGIFSYWTANGGGLYHKPRVNLRDTESSEIV